MKQQMIPNKKGKFNQKDNEMVKLTKIILKQTARHTHELKLRGQPVYF